VINEDPAFPATKHFPPTFPLTDEFYQVKNFSREKSHVLLRLDISKLPTNPNVHSTDGDFPLAWAKMYGKGRVFYSILGHDADDWDKPLRVSQLNSDSPYNTRKHAGLPPTPIGNPGLASLQAAAHPAHVDYLYFVRKPDKVHHYFTASFQDFVNHEIAYGYK